MIRPYDPARDTEIRIATLAQLTPLGRWQLELPHDRAAHLLIWLTRGQGVALLDGARRGVGLHNALFVPARHLVALDLGRQCFGQALILPQGCGLTLPERPRHLRIREAAPQGELTALFEAMNREQMQAKPLFQNALQAYGSLVSVWLRRHLETEAPAPRATAARRLAQHYCTYLTGHYADGAPMADHARTLGVTPTHLTRVCKAETGLTASALLNARLLHAAQSLLCDTDIAIQQVAQHLGFGSAAYFTRFIQQKTGRSPTGLRHSARRITSLLR